MRITSKGEIIFTANPIFFGNKNLHITYKRLQLMKKNPINRYNQSLNKLMFDFRKEIEIRKEQTEQE